MNYVCITECDKKCSDDLHGLAITGLMAITFFFFFFFLFFFILYLNRVME